MSVASYNALRRFAYKHGLSIRGARGHWMIHQKPDFLALIRAEVDCDRAHREWQRLSMIAALTRVIDTDRRLNAA